MAKMFKMCSIMNVSQLTEVIPDAIDLLVTEQSAGCHRESATDITEARTPQRLSGSDCATIMFKLYAIL